MTRDSGKILKERADLLNQTRETILEMESLMGQLSYSKSLKELRSGSRHISKLFRRAMRLLKRSKKLEKQYHKALSD